jgi:tetrahydromethanopterin S-methyltransferase subunit F
VKPANYHLSCGTIVAIVDGIVVAVVVVVVVVVVVLAVIEV